jgi:anti-anti-sigma factor
MVLQLGSDWTITQAAELRQQLLTQLSLDLEPVQLDLALVENMDSSGVQLVLALRSSLAARKQNLSLLNPSGAVCAALAAYGLKEELLRAG